MRLYLSPSTQPNNLYFDKENNEELVMNKVTDVIVAVLKEYEVTVIRGAKTKTTVNRIADANKSDIDYYLALHSNAGGGKGCETFYQVGTNKTNTVRTASKDYALKLNSDFAKITTTNDKDGDRGIKFKRLADGRDWNHELRGVNMPANLLEIEFHDTKAGSEWILKNIELIGRTIALSLVSMFNLKKLPEDEFYFVQTGAYKTLKEAEAEALKVAGFTKSEVGVKYGNKNALKWIKGVK